MPLISLSKATLNNLQYDKNNSIKSLKTFKLTGIKTRDQVDEWYRVESSLLFHQPLQLKALHQGPKSVGGVRFWSLSGKPRGWGQISPSMARCSKGWEPGHKSLFFWTPSIKIPWPMFCQCRWGQPVSLGLYHSIFICSKYNASLLFICF